MIAILCVLIFVGLLVLLSLPAPHWAPH